MGELKIKHKIATFSVVMAENNLHQACLYIYIYIRKMCAQVNPHGYVSGLLISFFLRLRAFHSLSRNTILAVTHEARVKGKHRE